jgi:solute carrier family 10 (sodium/bile acid cotransporter), member 7
MESFMLFKKFFLPIGLILAGVAAIISGDPGSWLKQAGAVRLFIIIIFLVNGYQLKLVDFKLEKGFIKTFIWAVFISLLCGPFIGQAIGSIVGLTGALALGLVVMSAVPSTLSSGIVITEVSGGNRLWALFLTIGLNIVGIFTIPFMLKLTLHASEKIEISPWPLFFKLFTYVLVPLLVGMLVRNLISGKDFSKKVKYIPSTCVILTVWVAISASRTLLISVPLMDYVYIIIAVLAVHLILLAVNAIVGKFILKLARPANKALIFTASQKTLPIAIGVLAVLGDQVAPALLTCLLFHFGQLLIDSILAAKMHKKSYSFGG